MHPLAEFLLAECMDILDHTQCPACSHLGLLMEVRKEPNKPFGVSCPGCNVTHEVEDLVSAYKKNRSVAGTNEAAV